MGSPGPRCGGPFLLLLFLACGPAPGVTTQAEDATDGPREAQGPVWLADVPAAVDFVARAEVAVVGFFQDVAMPVVSTFRSLAPEFPDVPFAITNVSQVLGHFNLSGSAISLFRLVDGQQLNLEDQALASLEPAKLGLFIRTHSLRLVTEYNAVTAVGLFNSPVEVHLLLLVDRTSPGFEDDLSRFREAARLYLGQVLFVLVDSAQKDNGRVLSYFRLPAARLPALAIYRTPDDRWATLPVPRVDVGQVEEFCAAFLAGKLPREDGESESSTTKEEL